MHIRSPKTKDEDIKKFEYFFKFLIQEMREEEFNINDTESKYSILYQKARNENWFFNCLLKYVNYINKRVTNENLSGATFTIILRISKNFG